MSTKKLKPGTKSSASGTKLEHWIKRYEYFFTVVDHEMIDAKLRCTSPPNVVDRLKDKKHEVF